MGALDALGGSPLFILTLAHILGCNQAQVHLKGAWEQRPQPVLPTYTGVAADCRPPPGDACIFSHRNVNHGGEHKI